MACILFVDDDPLTLETYQKIFTFFEYKVLLASSGEEALQVVEEKPVDLIVMDMRLEDMDSSDLIRRIKLSPRAEDIPVVIVSANPEIYADQAIKAGAQYYMSKPIQPEKIREILEKDAGS